MSKFVFARPVEGLIAAQTTKKDLIDSYDINNNSPAALSRTISVSEKVTDDFSWGLSQSFKVFAKVSGKAGVPFLAESKVETGFELVVGSMQNWKTSTEKLFSMTYVVNVPAYTNIRVSAWYEKIDDVSLDYTAQTEITGKTTRISIFDDFVKGAPATGEMIRR